MRDRAYDGVVGGEDGDQRGERVVVGDFCDVDARREGGGGGGTA